MSLRPSCIRFDSVSQVRGGWVSVEGGKAYRFDDIAQLESDCVAISNLGFNELFRTGLSSSSRIRTSAYLDAEFFSVRHREEKKKTQNKTGYQMNEAPNDIISHFGIEDDDWEKQVEVVSGVFSRVYSLANDSIGFKAPPFHELKKGIRQELLGHDSVVSDMTLLEAIESSTTHFSLVNRPIDSVQFDVDFGLTVGLPKASHALNILSKPLPKFGTKWKKITQKVKLKDVPSFMDSLETHGIYLFRVNFKSFDESMAHIINYGTGSESRRWITGVDALFLKDYATFEIFQGYEAVSVIEHDSCYPAISSAFNPEQHDFSYSAGLFLQNVWTGLASSFKPPAHVLKDNEACNFYTPFLKSYDRIELIKTAKKLVDENLLVSSYAKGDLRIVLKDYQLNPKELFNKLESAGVIPYGLNMTLDKETVDLSDAHSLLRHMYLSSDTESIIELDTQLYGHLM